MRRGARPNLPDYDGMRVGLPRPTPVVKQLLIANGAVFLAIFFLGWTSADLDQGLKRWLGLAPSLWRTSFPFVPVWQLATYGFLHTELTHLFWNLLQLYFFGTMLEGVIGSRRFLCFYLVAILLGGIAQLTGSLVAGDTGYAIGASGGVLAAVVAAAVLQPNAVVFLLFIPITLKWLAVAVVALDVYGVLVAMKTGASDGVAHWAHLGGAAWAFAAARRRWIWIDPFERLEARRARVVEDHHRTDRERMDQLLEKIHREGMGSLSRHERDFLKRVSKRR